MFLSGIADEAGQDIETQVKAHQELGWSHIELRLVDGVNITQLEDGAFRSVQDRLAEASLQCSCFGSAIGNWARPITGDFQVDLDDLQRALPRMAALKTPFIRVMSYPNDDVAPLSESAWRDEAIRRMKMLSKVAEDGGVTLVHENCSGWGGLSAENSLALIGAVDSPALRVVFDTGNPVTYGQDAWDYYLKVYDDIAYVHIKDAIPAEGEEEYCFCGEGAGYVREIVADLLSKGYDGGFSIEPHLAAVIHTGETTDDAEVLYGTYTEYGRRLMGIVSEVR